MNILKLAVFARHFEPGRIPHKALAAVRRQLPVLVGVAVLTITLLLWQELKAEEEAHIRDKVELVASSFKIELAEQIEERILALVQMTKHWSNYGKPLQQKWEASANLLVEDFGGYKAIAWMDPQGQVRSVVPPLGNEATQNLKLALKQWQPTAPEVILNRQEVVVTHPINLVQGGNCFLVYVPIFGEEQFDGFIVGVFDIQKLFDTFRHFLNFYEIALFHRNEEIYHCYESNKPHNEEFLKEEKLYFYGVTWRLEVWPQSQFLAKERSPFPEVVLGVGGVMALLLSWLVYLSQRLEERAKQLGATNQILEQEISDRQQMEVEIKARASQQEIIGELERQALSGTDLDPLIEQVLARVAEGLNVDYCKVVEIGSEEHLLLMLEIQNSSQGNPHLLDHLSGSLSVIIQGKNACYGILAAYSSRRQNFTEDDLHFLQSAANLMATTIERKQAEAALRESEARYRRMIETAWEGIWIIDANSKTTFVNRRMAEMLGYTVEEMIDKRLFEFIDDEWRAIAAYNVERRRQGFREQHDFKFRRKDGSDLWVIISANPIFDLAGNYTGSLGMITDITERRQAEEKIKASLKEKQASLKEKDVLLKEIHHRVKNNLLVVSSLLNFQANYVEDPEIVKMFEESQQRIYSMALVHEKLYESQDLAKVDFCQYLQDLISQLFVFYNLGDSLIDFKLDLEPIFINIETANPCGMIVSELVSNAMKYAFPGGKNGNIWVELHKNKENQINLTVRDDGIGFPEDLEFPNMESLGMQLVLTLTEQLEGTIELDRSNGTSFKLKFSELNYRNRLESNE
ncbi:MAG: histidine kinase dimerization/phosphoacceptor domain -containing protein [Xenococcaceae cyanobacterium]